MGKYLPPSVWVIVFFWVMVFNPYASNSAEYHSSHYSFYLLISLSLSVMAVIVLFRKSGAVTFTGIDLTLLAFLLVTLARQHHPGGRGWNEAALNTVMTGLSYILLRQEGSPRRLVWYALSAAYLAQITVMSCQFALTDQPIALRATVLKGTLGNSGIAAGFLAALTPALFHTSKVITVRRLRSLFRTVIFSVSFIFLLLTGSRAAIAALTAGMIFLRGRNIIAGNESWLSFRAKRFPAIVAGVLTLAALTTLLVLKYDSALGRIFIYRTVISNIVAAPLWGAGPGNFHVTYLNWQQAYFRTHGTSGVFAGLAGVIDTAFNEPLQILAELGLAGLGLFLFLLVLLLKRGVNGTGSRYAKSLLITFIALSLFSYPLHSLPMLMIFLFAAAQIASGAEKMIIIPRGAPLRAGLTVLLSGSLALCYYSYQKSSAMVKWDQLRDEAEQYDGRSLDVLRSIFPYLSENGAFLYYYAFKLKQHRRYGQAVSMYELARTRRVVIDGLLEEGETLEAAGRKELAERCYLDALYTVPNRFKPRSSLFRLYLAGQDTFKALAVARDIQRLELKFSSGEVYTIRAEIDTFLRNNQGAVRSGGTRRSPQHTKL